jgi:hypothetical protein
MNLITEGSFYIDIVVLWLDQGTQTIPFMDLRVKPEDDGRYGRDRNNTETDCLNLRTMGLGSRDTRKRYSL